MRHYDSYEEWKAEYDRLLGGEINRLNEDDYDLDVFEDYDPRADYEDGATPREAIENALNEAHTDETSYHW